MTYSIDEIIDFVVKFCGDKNVNLNSDLFKDIGVDGNDFDDLILSFSKKFHVDVSSFLWYFHSGEEAPMIRFVKTPDKKVKRIPITPLMLLEFANKGKWDIEYPPHDKSIAENRIDVFLQHCHLYFIYTTIDCFPICCL